MGGDGGSPRARFPAFAVVAWIKRLGLLEWATSGTGQEDAVVLNTGGKAHFILVFKAGSANRILQTTVTI
jgi:hypothetical protein